MILLRIWFLMRNPINYFKAKMNVVKATYLFWDYPKLANVDFTVKYEMLILNFGNKNLI